MKRYTSLLATIVLFSCQSQKPVSSITLKESVKAPKDEKREITIEKGKSLDIKTDNFGGMYFNLTDNPEKSVVTFIFDKGREADLPDSGYREQINFEIDTDKPEIELSGRDLDKANIVFGRWCFCPKGTVGNFRVRDGKLVIKRESGKLKLKLNFTVPEVPQIVKEIEAELK